jgi:glutathione S-transferase
MLTLYYAPGSLAFAPHMVLEELGLPHALERILTGEEQHRTAAYLKINPRGLLPALVLDDGQVLTETSAVLQYLAALRPQAALVPSDPLLRARCHEWLSVIGTGLQPAYALIGRPDRFTSDAATHESLSAAARARFVEILRFCESRVPEQGWLLGDFSVADPYLAVMVLWARYLRDPVQDLPRLYAWFGRVATRPSFARTLRAEGLIDAAGKPTPPARV